MIANIKANLSKLLPLWLGRATLLTKRMLVDTGYLKSGRRSRIVDAEQRPLPWYTYPAIAYIESLDLQHARILEFGSGSSTLFWQRRVHAVVSVEHDVEWHQTVQPELAPNTTYILAEDEESYVMPVDSTERFDVIVVDGNYRRRCIDTALAQRAEGGIIILDNSDWYPDLARLLRSSGLIQVDFSGFGPLLSHAWTTSLWLDGRYPPGLVEDSPRIPRGSSSFSRAMRDLVASKPDW